MNTDFRSPLVDALTKKYKADIADGIATALIYFNNPVGIGEHPQFLTELDKVITKISNAGVVTSSSSTIVALTSLGLVESEAKNSSHGIPGVIIIY